MNNDERFAIAQAMHGVVAEQVKTRTDGNLRAEADRVSLELYEQTGGKVRDLVVCGAKVGEIRCETKSSWAVTDPEAYTDWCRTHAAIDETELAKHPELQVLSEGEQSGPALIATPDFHEVYVLGHFEYGRDTLSDEYWRDRNQNLPIELPVNYFRDDDPDRQPSFTWRAHANLLYRNWLNWVYQMTTYDIDEIPTAIEQLRNETYEMVRKF